MQSSTQQAEAIAYVQERKHCVFAAAKKVNPRITAQDLDDLLQDGFLIALDILASGRAEQFEDLFWSKLTGSVWSSYDYLVDYVSCEEVNEYGEFTPSPILRAEAPSDLTEWFEVERAFEATTSSILDFLSPTERKILCLVLGLTAQGACAVAETARILGLSRLAVRTCYDRISKKVKAASRETSKEGWLILSRGKPRLKQGARRILTFH